MSRKSKKTGERLTWLIVVIVVVLVYAASFWYVKSSFEKASYALSSAEISYDQKDKIKNTAEAYKQLESEREKIDSYFVGADDVVSFINLLEQKATERGVSIETTNVSILEEQKDSIYGEILEVSVSVSGSWQEVMNYLKLVEGLPYNLWVVQSNVSLEQNRDDEEGGFYWEADIKLRVKKHES